MLGWSISIYRKAEYKDVNPDTWASLRLAGWMAGLGGLKWIDALVEEGKATVSGNGYPLWYVVKAEAILPAIASDPVPYDGPMVIGEDYVMPTGWTGTIKINPANIARCLPDEDLIIEAWDQS